MKNWKGFPYLMGGLAVALVAAGYLYLFCPAINVQNPGLWVMAAVLTLIFLVVSQLCRSHGEPIVSIVSHKGKQKHIHLNLNYKLYLIPVAMLVVLAAVLGGAWVMAHADNAGVAKRLAQQETRMQTLEMQTTTLRGESASRSSGVNVRQEAVRIGLRNSRGTQSAYVDVPDAATIDPANFGLQRDTASVFGQ